MQVKLGSRPSEQAECTQPAPEHFQEALATLQFEATESLPLTTDERVIRDLAKAILFTPSEVPFALDFSSADSLLAQQWNILKQGHTWLIDDYLSAETLAQSPIAPKLETGINTISGPYARHPREQIFDFREVEFTVPLYPNGAGNPMVEVQVNGETFRFWLDTGAGVSVISSKVAEKTGVKPLESEEVLVGSSTHQEVPIFPAYLDTLAWGGLTVYNHPCSIMDKEDLTFRLLGIPLIKIDGIIGWPLIKYLDLEIDMPGEQLTVRQSIEQGGSSGNFSWFMQPFFRLETETGCQLNLQLDTGSGTTFFHPTGYAKLNQDPEKSSALLVGGAGGTQKMRADELENLHFYLGDHVVDMAYADGMSQIVEPDEIFRFDGVLGQDVLRYGKLRLDFPNRKFEFSLPGEE